MSLEAAEDGEDCLVFPVDGRRDARRQRPELFRVLETARFVLEACVLALDELRVVDLLGDMAEIVRATLGICLTTIQIGDVTTYAGEIFVRRVRFRRDGRCAGEDIENVPLGFGV